MHQFSAWHPLVVQALLDHFYWFASLLLLFTLLTRHMALPKLEFSVLKIEQVANYDAMPGQMGVCGCLDVFTFDRVLLWSCDVTNIQVQMPFCPDGNTIHGMCAK